MEERSADRLARYIIKTVLLAVAVVLCWYFRKVIIYVIIAAVLSLLSRPVMQLLGKIRLAGKQVPVWLRTVVTMIVIVALFVSLVTLVIPVFSSVIETVYSNVSSISAASSKSAIVPFRKINEWIVGTFPNAGADFRIEDSLSKYIHDTFSLSSLSSILGSVASFIGNAGVGAFCTLFISFFFIKDPILLRKIVGALVPDRLEKTAIDAISEIELLLSRYFAGLVLEVIGVTIVNFLGLSIVAKLGWGPALGIAFMTGLLNIIPYVGPWLGGAMGVALGVALKYSSVLVLGTPNFNLLGFTLTLCAIFVFTQWIDNYLYQPMIYSTSIKAHPLEIFIVLIMAGAIGGMLGMLVAIPSYTVVRVIAIKFFPHVKAIRRLTA